MAIQPKTHKLQQHVITTASTTRQSQELQETHSDQLSAVNYPNANQAKVVLAGNGFVHAYEESSRIWSMMQMLLVLTAKFRSKNGHCHQQ